MQPRLPFRDMRENVMIVLPVLVRYKMLHSWNDTSNFKTENDESHFTTAPIHGNNNVSSVFRERPKKDRSHSENLSSTTLHVYRT